MRTKEKLIHLLTRWDKKQSKTKHYNPYALGIYLQAADEVVSMMESGKPLGVALAKCFNDRLLAFLEKNLHA